MGNRQKWDEHFMEIAQVAAKQSTCIRRKVGAVLAKGKRALATGHNGAPRGLTHCVEIGCLREQTGVPSGQHLEICRSMCAEQNAILFAAVHGTEADLEAATLYSLVFPCVICARMLINAGIKTVVYKDDYDAPLAKEMLQEAGVKVIKYG